MLISTRNVGGRSIIQVLVIFLHKLHHGSSNASIAAIFKLGREQHVSFREGLSSVQVLLLMTVHETI